jgi:uncharacterized protein (DUF2267 family)
MDMTCWGTTRVGNSGRARSGVRRGYIWAVIVVRRFGNGEIQSRWKGGLGMTQPREVVHASALFQEWLSALKTRAMLQTHNQSQAMLRAVLHALRRHMDTDQILNFADALPPLPRGIFLERWRPSHVVPLISTDAFVEEVTHDLAQHQIPPASIVADVFAVLRDHAEPPQAAAMRERLPEALRSLWDD